MKKLKIDKQISWTAVFVLISCEFLSQRINLALLLLFIAFLAFKSKRISVRFPGAYIYAYLFIAGLVIGFIHLFSGEYLLYLIVKHAYYYILPLLYWVVGRAVCHKGKKDIFKTILVSASIFSVFDLLRIVLTIVKGGILSLYQYREIVGTGSFLPLIGIYIILYYKSSYKRSNRIPLLLLYGMTFIAHFSRTHILELVILILFSGIKYNWKKILQISLIAAVVGIGVTIAMPTVMSEFWMKLFTAITEINFGKGTTWDFASINQNWRGYEMYCELIKFHEASFFEKIFGGGFGATLDVFGYAYLVTTEDALNILHNGYGTQLMVWGVHGLILFFVWISRIYNTSRKMRNAQDGRLIKGIAIDILVTTYFVMGPFFNHTRAVYLMYIAMIEENNKSSERMDINYAENQ